MKCPWLKDGITIEMRGGAEARRQVDGAHSAAPALRCVAKSINSAEVKDNRDSKSASMACRSRTAGH